MRKSRSQLFKKKHYPKLNKMIIRTHDRKSKLPMFLQFKNRGNSVRFEQNFTNLNER